jgi:CheY-like chemotaxis protein
MTVIERQLDSGHWHAVRGKAADRSGTGLGRPSKVFLRAESKLKVLLVEDNPADSERVLHELRRGGFDVSGEIVETAEAFRQRVKERTPDLVLADYNLGHWRGMEALEILHFEGLDIPLILLSDTLGEVTAVECIK